MDTAEIVNNIKRMMPNRRPIEHHEPFIDKKDTYDVMIDCISKGVSNYYYVDKFENWLKKLTKADYVLTTNTGTAALHLALMAAGVKHGDEVIVPNSSFVATANAVAYIGAVPHFIDSDCSIDPNYLRHYLKSIGKSGYNGKSTLNSKSMAPITAIVVVHLLGFPNDMVQICEIAKEFNLIVIEDASQALGTTLNGQHVGTFGWVGTFSFNNNKILTTNGGGAVITNSANIYYEAKQLGSTYRKAHPWLIEHEELGWNYRMGNINAALGMAQTYDFERTLLHKYALRAKYEHYLDGIDFVSSKDELECSPNCWLNTILVDNRDELLEALHKEGIKARALFTPTPTLPFYDYKSGFKYQYNISDGKMDLSESLFKRAVCLPSGNL